MASQEPVLLGNTASSGGKQPAKDKSMEQPKAPAESQSWFGCGAPSEDLSAAIEMRWNTMEHAPAIATMQLCTGWNKEVHKHLQAALQTLIDQNPIFTGKLVMRDGRHCVLPGFYTLKDLFLVKEGPSTSVPTSILERTTFMQQVLEPLLTTHLGTGVEQLAEASPLLKMEVLTLSDGMACICLAISHSVVDGMAYNHVMKLINDARQGKEISPMQWEVPEQHQKPPEWSALPMVPGILSQLAMRKLTGFKSNPINSFVVDADECAKLRESMKGDCAFLSNYDVVTAAMAEVLPGRYTWIAKDLRKKAPGVESYLGGTNVLTLEGTVAGDPAAVRKLKGLDTGVPSVLSRATLDFHVVQGWYSDVWFTGSGLVCEACCPLGAFVGQALTPVAVVINADEKTTLVNHNMDAKTLKLLARGKLLSRLMKAD